MHNIKTYNDNKTFFHITEEIGFECPHSDHCDREKVTQPCHVVPLQNGSLQLHTHTHCTRLHCTAYQKSSVQLCIVISLGWSWTKKKMVH